MIKLDDGQPPLIETDADKLRALAARLPALGVHDQDLQVELRSIAGRLSQREQRSPDRRLRGRVTLLEETVISAWQQLHRQTRPAMLAYEQECLSEAVEEIYAARPDLKP